MAISWTWKGGNGTVTIGATDLVGFWGTNVLDAVIAGQYQDSSHAMVDAGTPKVPSALPNVKYPALPIPANTSCTLNIRFSNDALAVKTRQAKFWAYSKLSGDSVSPVNVNVFAGEAADVAWTDVRAAVGKLSLDDHNVAANDHDFYIGASASPAATGLLDDFALKMSLEYY